ncbi:apses-domain-containing protein [Fistulina hepatica ATCC 64428]|uniref:Apses-domain-containing protein n=1 Tax=Fistulina hepatica ATCC 64428 TaxID=1128425 RepID=A0A0D7AI14_9AGAR|nr:apses-domain-containing protein [Fistulina hepatica ATCC 64428]
MQAGRPGSNQPPVKIYNAVYSSVQVYECMIRGIAVMRRRADSYVNATQILKVAGIDKGRRTKILEKEILPGVHEIVQGGYGKYQGTWIPLDRGRDIAAQYGLSALLAPLFDFQPNTSSLTSLPVGMSAKVPAAICIKRSYLQAGSPDMGNGFGAPSIIPGSALRLLNQGRAQGLFTPSTSSNPVQDATHVSRPASAAPYVQHNGDGNPSPSKRARIDATPPLIHSRGGLSHLPSGGRTRYADPGDRELPTPPPLDTRRGTVVARICQSDDPGPVLELLREISQMIDMDTILDDQGHTALHVAASLAHLQTVEALIEAGADVHRGNHLGETPLMRVCLATHASDRQAFPALLAALSASLRTLDTSRKSVLHHIAALAGAETRAHHAKYFLDCVLTWIATREDGDFASIVDLQDEHGDTALNIAARVGSRGIVRTLLDVNANRSLPNKLGLRPGDFGVEPEEFTGDRTEDLKASLLRPGPPAPIQKSNDVIADMTAMIQSLTNDFQAEIKSKQDTLDVTQAHLRAATRELAEQRKQIQTWQSKCGEYDQITQKLNNLRCALEDEDHFDWTGRYDIEDEEQRVSALPPSAFAYRGPQSVMGPEDVAYVDPSFAIDPDPPMPTESTVTALIRLRRLKMWHMRMEEVMHDRLQRLKGASAEKEFQCKKIVALCTGVPIDQVENNLSELVVSLESEPQATDLSRVSGFMQKVWHALDVPARFSC